MGELNDYLALKKADIAIILETKLRTGDTLDFDNFSIERQDRINQRNTGYGRGGGVLILIKSGINYKRIKNFQTSIEHVAISLNNNTMIVGTYAPPWLNMTINDLSPFFTTNSRCLLLGDLNAKHTHWNNHINNRNGHILHEYLQDNANLQLLYTDEPTHHPLDQNSMPSYIDIGINKGLTNLTELRTETALNSDHLPVQITLDDDGVQERRTVFDYTNFNWPKYRQQLNRLTVIQLNKLKRFKNN